MGEYLFKIKVFLLTFVFLSIYITSTSASSVVRASQNTPSSKHAVWGKVLKTKNLHGYTYFVYFKSEGQSYAYPLATKSSVKQKKLDALAGKYARIYGKEKLELITLEGSKHILTFEVSDVKELKLSDLNQNLDAFKERMDIAQISKRQLKSDQAVREGISDKTVNTAIFVGGAVLATQVLSVLLSK